MLKNKKIVVVSEPTALNKFLVKSKNKMDKVIVLITDTTQVEKLSIHKNLKIINVCNISSSEKKAFLDEYIDFIGNLNINASGLKWWSYGLFSKDNASSPFFNELFKFYFFVKNINSTESSVIVISDSVRVAFQIEEYYENKNYDVDMVGFKNKFYYKFISFLQSTFSILAFFWNQLSRIFICKIFLSQRKLISKKPNGKKYIIRSWTTNKTLSIIPYNDIYFNNLHSDLISKGYEVGMVAGVIGNFIGAVKKMKQEGMPLPQESLLKFFDPINMMISYRPNQLKIVDPAYFKEIDVSHLINSCLSFERECGNNLNNMIYYIIGKRMIDLYKPDYCLLGHENYPWEKLFVLGMKSTKSNVHIIGYQHSVLYSAFTTVLLSRNEKNIIPLPDRIVTIGEITKEYLEIKGNYDSSILLEGCALSDSKSSLTLNERPKSNNILVILGCYPRAKIMLDFVLSSLKDSDFHLILRPHPASPLHGYSDKLIINIASFKNLEESTYSLERDLKRSVVVLYDGSKVALEAMRFGLPVININPFFDSLSFDPLINWVTFKWVASSKESLLKSLDEIMSMDNREYDNKRKEAIKYSKDYLGEKKSNYLDAFTLKDVSLNRRNIKKSKN